MSGYHRATMQRLVLIGSEDVAFGIPRLPRMMCDAFMAWEVLTCVRACVHAALCAHTRAVACVSDDKQQNMFARMCVFHLATIQSYAFFEFEVLAFYPTCLCF